MAVIKKDGNSMGLPMNIKRSEPIPLDKTELYYSYDDAVAYAKSATAYVGQSIKVIDETSGDITWYIIGTDTENPLINKDAEVEAVESRLGVAEAAIAEIGSVNNLDYSEFGLTDEEKNRLIKMQLDAPVISTPAQATAVLNWNTVYGANKYYVYSEDLPAFVDETGLVATVDSPTTQLDLGSVIGPGFAESAAIESGEYTFYVVAGDGKLTNENRSNPDESNRSVVTKLPAPVVTLAGNVLSWNVVDKISYAILAQNSLGVAISTAGMTICCQGKDYGVVAVQSPPTGNVSGNYQIHLPGAAADTYSFYVVALTTVGTGYCLGSNLSDPVYFTVEDY